MVCYAILLDFNGNSSERSPIPVNHYERLFKPPAPVIWFNDCKDR